MSDQVARLPKPQMRGLLKSAIGRNLTVALVGCTAAGLYMKFIFGYGNKQRYADFYKNYDIEKEFQRMRKKGLFDSCEPTD